MIQEFASVTRIIPLACFSGTPPWFGIDLTRFGCDRIRLGACGTSSRTVTTAVKLLLPKLGRHMPKTARHIVFVICDSLDAIWQVNIWKTMMLQGCSVVWKEVTTPVHKDNYNQ